MDIVYVVTVIWLFMLGACLGSFLNVCIYRLPRHEGVWRAWGTLLYPPSHCPKCQSPIRSYDNLPIFGWLLLRGRCRDCRLKISWRYPAIELLTALIFVGLYFCEVYPPGTWQLSTLYQDYGPFPVHGPLWWSGPGLPNWRYGFHMVLVIALIAATFIDFDLMIIPDSVTRPATIVGILGNFVVGQFYLVPVWYSHPRGLTARDIFRMFSPANGPPSWIPPSIWEAITFTGVPQWVTAHPHWHGLAVSLAGIAVGALIVWIVRVVGFWSLNREAMGDGDIYLLAMVGAFLGWQATVVVFFLAPFLALLVTVLMLPFQRSHEIPYGPYLSAATLLLLAGWKWIYPPFEQGMLSLGVFLPVVVLVMVPSMAGLLMLSKCILRRLGVEYVDEALVEWLPADQLAYLAGEQVDQQQGRWPADLWPGARSSRGQEPQHVWRSGLPGSAWRAWQQRK